MHWYEKLNAYFPIEEMKLRPHMEALLDERSDIYHRDEDEHHVLLYAELDEFVFVDYLLVMKEARGQGLGKQLLDKLKAKGKPILLEVEPLDYEDTDTVKRHRFYAREGFRVAQSVDYRRRSIATGEEVPLEILFWCPDATTSEQEVFEFMAATYRKVHTWRDKEWYGEAYQPVEEALTYSPS
jgi:GNAT superfamily N-acetyltransferase